MSHASLEESGEGKRSMPTWRPPPALGEGGLGELWDRLYPLKVYNSLTRTKVCPIAPTSKIVVEIPLKCSLVFSYSLGLLDSLRRPIIRTIFVWSKVNTEE